MSQVFPTFDSYREAWAKAYKEDPPVPLNVDIELASICNLACPMCYYGEADFIKEMKEEKDWDGGKKRRFMPADMAFRLIDECADIGVPALKMNFRGESTLHPQYWQIMGYARSKALKKWPEESWSLDYEDRVSFYEILVNTNANCNDKAIDGLMSATKVMVSLDSMVPETYEKIRVNGKLERALEVIGELRRRQHPGLWVRRVVTTINREEPFIAQVKEKFGEDIHVSEHFAFDRNHYAHLALEKEDFETDKWKRTYCGYPSQRLIVTASGLCLPCCVDWRQELSVGDWPRQTLLEIWNGDPMRRLRENLRADRVGDPKGICANCTSYMAYQRPERGWVQDREEKASLK